MNLKVRTARNSLLMSSVMLALRVINFAVTITLARLLEPSDFGLVALAMLLMQASNLFTGLGMGQALIYSREERRTVAFPAFVIVMAAGILFFSLVQLNSDWLAWLLGEEQTSPVLRWLSYLILLNALSLIPLSLLRKELMFGPIGLAQVVSQVVNGVVAISLAFYGYGVWSIVYATLINTLVSTVIFWIACPGWDWVIPHAWNWRVVRGLLGYGLQTTANGGVSYLHKHVDDWLVGRALGAQALGFYNQAYDFSNSTIANLGKNVIANVFFPSYAKIQDDKERLARAYLKSVNLVLLCMTPMALGILVTAPQLVAVILSEKWLPIVPVLQVFALLILTGPISENSAPLFQAVGLPNYNVHAGLVLLSVLVPMMFLLLDRGIVGIALAVVIAHFVGMVYNLYQMNRVLPGTARKTLALAAPILSVGVVMAVAVQGAKPVIAHLAGGLENLAGLFGLIGIGAALYIGGCLITQRPLLKEVLQLLVTALPLKKRTQPAT